MDRKKFANAILKGDIPSSLVDDYSETKPVPLLKIKPKLDAQNLGQDTMSRVASLTGGVTSMDRFSEAKSKR